MKWLLPVAGLALFGFGLGGRNSETVYVIVTGGARGSIAPCGCTKPMTGGLRRMASMVRELKTRHGAIWIDTGNITNAPGRQSELKVETYAQVLGELGVDTFAVTQSERSLGEGVVLSMKSLAKGVALDPIERSSINLKGLTILLDIPGIPHEPAEITLSESANHQDSGSVTVFPSGGAAIANGPVVSPGEALRGLVLLKFVDGQFKESKAIPLEPRVADDPQATKAFDSYLSRLRAEKLAQQVLRTDQGRFSGSASCTKCHPSAAKVHLKSAHSHAMKTLTVVKHEADPDCISCHSVGFEAKGGFSPLQPKKFAEVGCESCHGASADHAAKPKQFRLQKVGEKKCLSCHTTRTSPAFNFAKNWARIKHR
ncbi:MAG: cytochrome c family protein [Armatimonadota bacterium]